MFTALNERGDPLKGQQIPSLRSSQWKPSEEREDPALQIGWTGDLVVEDPVHAPSYRSDAKHGMQELREPRTELRHVERNRDAPRQSPITLSSEGNIEASLSFDEPRNVVPDVIRDSIQPACMAGPFLLIARAGRIVTCHSPTLPSGSDMAGTAGYSGVPAYGQLHFTPSPA
jgi:hypothetical protein